LIIVLLVLHQQVVARAQTLFLIFVTAMIFLIQGVEYRYAQRIEVRQTKIAKFFVCLILSLGINN